jgi:hypothetical protein
MLVLYTAAAGGLAGFGGGMEYATSRQNKPTSTGQARLDRPNPAAKYGLDRSFHLDYDPRFGYHFNGEIPADDDLGIISLPGGGITKWQGT